MNEIQNKLLDMLKMFHNFCIVNNLTYYAIGGTLLGAVRHSGFIPWDDDIDIGMPREDYDNMINLFKKNNNNSVYKLETPFENKDFTYQYCKLYDTTTMLIEKKRHNIKRGIYLDIFPIDGIGNTFDESLKNFKKIDRNNKYINTKTCALSKHRKLYKNLAIIVSRCILFPTWKSVLRKTDKLCRMRNFNDYQYVANLYGSWHEKEIVKREWFGTPKIYDFESIQILGLQDSDSYLKALYGDYMQLPPKKQQKTHHKYIELNLNQSYLEV